jgi:hypothetical protein
MQHGYSGHAEAFLHAARKERRHPRRPGVTDARSRDKDDVRFGSAGTRDECGGDRAVQPNSALQDETASGGAVRGHGLGSR